MAAWRTPEGFLHVPAKIARTGIQEYLARELRAAGVPMADSVPDNAIVRIYRDAAEVFDAEALSSFEHKPTTLGHPSGGVNPSNVKQLQTGFTKAPVTQDGSHVSVGVVLQDSEAIKAYESGVRELSCGYRCGVTMTPGMTADGQPYDGRQVKIIGNHVAQLPRGRAGSTRLGDNAVTRSKGMNEEERKAYEAALKDAARAASDLEDLKKENDRLAGEVEALKASQVSDEAVQKMVADGVAAELAAQKQFAEVLDRARKFAPKIEVTDGMTIRQVEEIAVKARYGKVDLADKPDDFIEGMFAVMTEPSAPATPVKDGAPKTQVKITRDMVRKARMEASK